MDVYDALEERRRFKADLIEFSLSSKHWRKYKVNTKLSWGEVRFDASQKKSVPKEKGVYAFVVRHDENQFPAHGFVMYVGQVGADSKRSLRDRFGDYLRDRERAKSKTLPKKKLRRLHVLSMLIEYEADLYFKYANLGSSPTSDLLKLEKELNDAMLPPVSQTDFTAEVKQIRESIY